MTKEMGVIILGAAVAILPQLGFPSDIKSILFTVLGIAIAVVGFLLRGAVLSRGMEGSESHPKNRVEE